MRHLRDTIGGKVGELFGFCLRLVLYAAIVTEGLGMIDLVQGYFSELCTLTGGLIPCMGVLYALGGNLGQAAVNEELLLVFLGICEFVSATVTPPFCGVCLTFSLLDAFVSKLRLSPVAALLKKWYTTLLGLIMFLLTTALSLQSILTSRTDSLGMKGIKYVVGNMIPVVGGAISGTLGTVAAGVDMMRGVCGVCGIVLVALLLLPTLLQVLLFRWVFDVSGTVASLISCDGEARLMGEMASLYGYLASAVSICAVVLMIALGLLTHSVSALG